MVRSPRSCEGTPLKAAPIVVCARTSLAVTTRARSAMRGRRGLTPRRACELDGSQHTSGAKAIAHAPPVGGDLWMWLGWRPATPSILCRRLGGSGGNAQSQRVARWFPSFRRGRAKEARARTVAPLRYIEVAGCTAPRLAQSGTSLWMRTAVQTGATKQRCSVF